VVRSIAFITALALCCQSVLAQQSDAADASLTAQSVFRGQSPVEIGSGIIPADPYATSPNYSSTQPHTTFYQDPTYGTPGGTIDPYFNGQPNPYGDPYANPYGGGMTTDPFLGGPGSYVPNQGNPYTTPSGGIFGKGPAAGYGAGLNGPRPYEYRWVERFDAAWFSDANTSTGGDFGVTEINYDKERAFQWGNGFIFSLNPQYNLRLWEGPKYPAGGFPVGGSDLPGATHRFGLGMKLATQNIQGWTFELGFNPSIGTDFNSSLSRDAWMLDGHVVGYWQYSACVMFALGAAYWDRVDDIILPYAGVVWTPNDYLEIRAVFPKPRISMFMGTPGGIATWAYLQAEYHVEAYQIEARGFGSTQMQMEDWRLSLGLYGETGAFTTFGEVGYVFSRDVKYSGAVAPFAIDDGLFLRTGFRF